MAGYIPGRDRQSGIPQYGGQPDPTLPGEPPAFNDFTRDRIREVPQVMGDANITASSMGDSPGAGNLEGILQQYFEPALQRQRRGNRQLEGQLLDQLLGGSGPQVQQAGISPVGLNSITGAVQQVGEGVANELFAEGGPVEQATSSALRQSVKSGFGGGGGFDRARLNVLGGASDQVANRIAQAAPQLAQTAVQQNLGLTDAAVQQNLGTARIQSQDQLTRLGEANRIREQNAGILNDLRQSMFTGQASAEQLRLAREQLEQNQRIINERIAASRDQRGGGVDVGEGAGGALSGAATGAAVGSIVPGLGTGIGAAVGGGIGLLGGLFG